MQKYYQWFPDFGVDIVDHPCDSVDSERFLKYLTILNSNDLTKSMGPEMKRLRLLSMWNQELILRNIT